MRSELETLNWIRLLMRPINFQTAKNKQWIAGRYVEPEEYVLINLRQKVLKRIDKLEKERCLKNECL